MKIKEVAAFALFGLLTVSAAQADSNDVSAVLPITGVVSSANEGCRVTLSKENILFAVKVSEMISQGENATEPQLVNVLINGAHKDGACAQAVLDGHIAVKFIGVADNADGTTLANQFSSQENAANGVGIGFFTSDNTPLAINKDTLKVSKVTYVSDEGIATFGVQPVKLTNQKVTTGGVSGAVTVEVERL
ncbi:fimbrial protein [Cronobacter malonaticus]